MLKFLKWTLLTVVSLYVVLCVGLYFEQAKFIFVPQREVLHTPKEFGCDAQEIIIDSGGQMMRGWWLSADPRVSAQMGSRTIVYFHGNGGSIGANAEHACRLRNLGLNVLVFDYRGYGQSSDISPTEESVFSDADAAWNYLVKERNVDPHKIIIYGHSLGGAVAIEMAKRHPDAAALITESTFTSIRAMADLNRNFRFFPLSLILNQKMESLDKIKSIRMPTFIIHGTADEVVPSSMGEQLYAASAGAKEIYLVGGAGHENCAAMAGQEYQRRVREFLNSAPGPDGPHPIVKPKAAVH